MDLTNPITIITIVFAAFLVAWSVFVVIKRQSIYKKLRNLLVDGRFDDFFTLIDSKLTRAIFPEYNRNFFKLNAYQIEGNDKETYHMLNELLTQKLSRKQRTQLVIKAFSFYIEKRDAERSKAMLNEIQGWDSTKHGREQLECQRMYDVMILKESNHIDEMLEELDKVEGVNKASLEFLLSMQYENLGDTENQEKYRNLAVEHTYDLSCSDATGATNAS